ncbi:MAG: hypothetical protein JSS66_05100 [Armatimonadetes bacterium]|nr:hypothetical protein [Armatimonadota bacterium]
MANTLYDKGREAFLAGDADWDANTIKIALLSASYTFSQSHQYLSDVTGVVATSSALSSKTVTNGVADAADVTFSAVTGSQVTQFIIYVDSGVAGTSRLLVYFDTATNLPVTPNGGDIGLTFDNGSNKIFRL